MSSLPVAAVLPELLSALQHAPQVLLNAPTGAGKSTWLPLQILAEGNIAGRIILLEPRRLAARNVAQRLAELLGEKPGETVGFRMRAETCVGPQTRLEVVTEGILTRMIQRDPELTGVGLVILDEFHERSLQADLALALLLDVQQGLRDDLKLLIMSATLDNDRLQRLLPEAPVVVSEGRAYPVERRFSPLSAHQRFDEAVAVAAAELLRHEQGSMLLFLPGVGEIQRVQEQLTERVAEDVILCPLYGALPLSEQRKAILPAPAGKRKVVLATNIAETSLTIEGIRLVVDSAQERVARFDPRTGLTRLVTQRISQASMTQRAGRAGRLSPGICLHLLGKEQAERAAAQSEPEILHSDLSALLLELLQWGCHDPAALAWLDQPPAVNLAAARRLLEALSALDGERLSAFGRKMAALGNEPRLAAMLAAAQTGIREKGLGVLNWTPEAEQLRLRLHCAAQWLPEEAWPAVDDASLLASLETWLLPQMNGVHSLRALKALDLRQALQDWLPWPLRQKLDRELPTHYTVPTGSRLAIRYHAENSPALAVRMQEMFGEATTPVIAEGRVPLVLELLSPAQRPLQITRDLSAFWQGSYREVQKEMKGRYPKHVWPDDPANAAPTRRSKKYS